MSVANRETRPVIFGLEGTSLTAEEVAFFHENRPWGIILFARNIETREQLCALTDDLREKSGNAYLPIFIDQEGGRVARLEPPLVRTYPPAHVYTKLFVQNAEAGTEAAHLGAMLLALKVANSATHRVSSFLMVAEGHSNGYVWGRGYPDTIAAHSAAEVER